MSPAEETLRLVVARGVVELPPPTSCDVCGYGRGIRRVEPGDLRRTMAPWIRGLCERCFEKYRDDRYADDEAAW